MNNKPSVPAFTASQIADLMEAISDAIGNSDDPRFNLCDTTGGLNEALDHPGFIMRFTKYIDAGDGVGPEKRRGATMLGLQHIDLHITVEQSYQSLDDDE